MGLISPRRTLFFVSVVFNRGSVQGRQPPWSHCLALWTVNHDWYSSSPNSPFDSWQSEEIRLAVFLVQLYCAIETLKSISYNGITTWFVERCLHQKTKEVNWIHNLTLPQKVPRRTCGLLFSPALNFFILQIVKADDLQLKQNTGGKSLDASKYSIFCFISYFYLSEYYHCNVQL